MIPKQNNKSYNTSTKQVYLPTDYSLKSLHGRHGPQKGTGTGTHRNKACLANLNKIINLTIHLINKFDLPTNYGLKAFSEQEQEQESPHIRGTHHHLRQEILYSTSIDRNIAQKL